MITLLHAVAHEGAVLKQALARPVSSRWGSRLAWQGMLGRQMVTLAEIGMGTEQAAQGSRIVLSQARPNAVVLLGYSGALVPRLLKGRVVMAENLTTWRPAGLGGVTSARAQQSSVVVGTRAQRLALHQLTGAELVDMESHAVAEECGALGLPLLVLRAISDDLSEDLPVDALAAAYDPGQGRPTPLRMVRHFCAHPGELPAFARFVGGLAEVRQGLTKAVLRAVEG
jgi:adenosylhomocysteine nucleosidase